MILHNFFHQSVVEAEFPQSGARDGDGRPGGSDGRCGQRGGRAAQTLLHMLAEGTEAPATFVSGERRWIDVVMEGLG